MPGLVLEGGTFRPIFSSGVMDAMLDSGVHFPYVIGVSAGISHGVSYVSRQKGRNLKIAMDHRHDKRYIGFRNYFTDRSLFGIKFVYEELPRDLIPFDWETYLGSGTQVRVVVSRADTGKAEYLDGKTDDRTFPALKATCAIPYVFPAIEVNGAYYYDGGICDSIPAQRALDDGNDKLLIILTRPKGYLKQQSKASNAAARLLKRKYPALSEALRNRHDMYNAQLRLCEKLEKEGRAVVLRPSEEKQIDSFEKNLDKIRTLYEYGYALGLENMDRIRALF